MENKEKDTTLESVKLTDYRYTREVGSTNE